MRPARPRAGFSKYLVLPPRKKVVLSTSRQVESEIFSSLSYLSEVPDAGKKFINERNPQDPNSERTFLLFRAFIRQAKTFWEAALPLHHRAGPLNYYYCFLNLVKAYLAVVDPQSVSGRILHGLSAGDPPESFSDATAKVQPGVFQVFYRRYFGIQWPEELRINIISALAFCGDVTHEFETGGFGRSPRLMGIARLETHEHNAFATLALSRYELLKDYPEMLSRLEAAFDVVDLPSQLAEREFDLFAEEAMHFAFLETKKVFPLAGDVIPKAAICQECYSALKDHYLFVPYKIDRLEFSLYVPYSEKPYAPFNEVVAIYVVMYYLSSLVRYHPSYLEEMLESKDAWLIENFALSAPRTFIRHMVNLILDEERVYHSL